MTTTESTEFQSIRRGLKVCSLLLVLMALVEVPALVISVRKFAEFYHDMMGSQLPAVFQVTNALCDHLFLVAIAMLVIFILALVITLRARSGIFLYVACGVFFVGWLGCLILAFAVREAVQPPIEMLFRANG